MGKSATCDKQEFCAVLRTALAKRLFPVTSLHRKQIADALGTHRDNVDRWFNGESELRGGTLRELVRFFWDRGDRAFLFEILGIEPMSIMPSAAQIAEAVKAKGLAA